MEPYFEHDGIVLYHGDVLDCLKELPDNSVHCVVTSPPYFALRSYLPKDHTDKAREIGSEPTPEDFISTMVAVFREVRRVLRDDGTCWINLGDSYAGSGKSTGKCELWPKQASNRGAFINSATPDFGVDGQLLNIPHRVAEALRQDGWVWRQTLAWCKKSPMPESCAGWRWVRHKVKVRDREYNRSEKIDAIPAGWNTAHQQDDGDGNFTATQKRIDWQDCPGCEKCLPNGGLILRRGSGRCTTAHEYIFMFTKGPRYFWDAAASQEPATSSSGGSRVGKDSFGSRGENGHGQSARRLTPEENAKIRGGTRNPRSFFLLSGEPTRDKHFATFPSELVRRLLSCSVSAVGVCSQCGAPRAPVIESKRIATRTVGDVKMKDGDPEGDRISYDHGRHIAITKTDGYRQTCKCAEHKPTGAVVCDPFSGLATTGQTARQLGHCYIGIDLNEVYLKISAKRIFKHPVWWKRLHNPKQPKIVPHASNLTLF
jgi:DNA modification methylase